MHNNIMAAGTRIRPPMLRNKRYAQCPYTPVDCHERPAVPCNVDSPRVPEQTTVRDCYDYDLKNRAHFESEKEAIHLILIGIGDEIYSTVDACQTAQEMWKAIERLDQQGE
ncbi:hypothetical protein Tco_1554371 [Tanacetum coccineum]